VYLYRINYAFRAFFISVKSFPINLLFWFSGNKTISKTKIILPDDLEKEFREEVFRRLGMKKGNITLAIEEAIKDWLKKKS